MTKAVKKAAKTKDPVPLANRRDAALALMERFNHKMRGRAELVTASELPYLTKRLPTGLLTLDLELRGGFPSGGLSQIIGRRSSGKSYIYWQVIRQLQRILGEKMSVLLAMTEIRADRSQGRSSGVAVAYSGVDIAAMNTARVKNGVAPFTKEEIADLSHEVGAIHELHADSAESFYDGILAAVEANAYHLIVIDSIGSVISGAEAEAESLSEKTYGGSAGVNTQFLRKLVSLLLMRDQDGHTRDPCILGINQVRDNIKDPNRDYKAPGGNMLEHTKLVDIFMHSGKAIGENQSVNTPSGTVQRYVQFGKEMNWRIEKGKCGIHEGGRGAFNYLYDLSGADFHLDAVIAGVRHGVIEQAGAWLGIRDPADPEKYLVRTNGRDAFVALLREDEAEKTASGDPGTFMRLIRDLCFRAAEINISYDWT